MGGSQIKREKNQFDVIVGMHLKTHKPMLQEEGERANAIKKLKQ